MKYLIYKHTSKTTGKSYIGVTSRTIEKRFSDHLTESRCGSKSHFHKALRKYGKNDFISDILKDNLTECEAYNTKEPYYIKKYNTYKNGYNMTTGGDRGPRLVGSANGMYNKNHTAEVCKAISDAKKLLVGDKHPHYGKISPLKGKTYEQIVGKEHALRLRKEKSKALTGIKRPYNLGENNPAKREDVKRKISLARRKEISLNGVTYECKKDACEKLNISLYKLNKLLEGKV